MGLPDEARRALEGLYQRVKGRYETAYGSCEEFLIQRGFIQGALESPALCKIMMNTLLELLELKCDGFEYFTPTADGEQFMQLVFADDAVNGAKSLLMLQRIATFLGLPTPLPRSRARNS